MTSSFIVYIAVGKLLIFFSQKFAKDNGIINGFIGRLLNCGLCWGFWVYGLLSLLLGEIIFKDFFYVPILSEIVTGGLTSLMVHLVNLGWKEQFEIIIVE